MILISHDSFVHVLEYLAFTRLSVTLLSDVVATQNHILRWNCNNTTIGWLQQVVWREQHEAALCLCFLSKWQMGSHLVTIEVGVESHTCQWMQADSLTFYKDWLEGLDTKSMQCRSTVQHYWVLLNYIFKNVPNVI